MDREALTVLAATGWRPWNWAAVRMQIGLAITLGAAAAFQLKHLGSRAMPLVITGGVIGVGGMLFVLAVRARVLADFATTLREAIDAGEIAPDIDPKIAACALWAMCSGILALGSRSTHNPLTDDRLSRLLEFFEILVQRGITTPQAQ